MKKHLSSAAILSVLILVLCLHSFAAEDDSFGSGMRPSLSSGSGYLFSSVQDTVYTDYVDVIPSILSTDIRTYLHTEPDIIVNGTPIGHMTAKATINDTAYVAAVPVLQCLYPSAVIGCQDGHLTAAAADMVLHANAGDAYFQVNEQYVYAPDLVIEKDGTLLLPVGPLCDALGCSVLYGQDLIIRQVAPVVTGHTYIEEDLYWLSHAIYSESGNQPMKGRIAVGTVILKRVASPRFPNTIKEVVFAPGQFSPVANGTIYRDPDKDSIVAAKLCLDGVQEAKDCLYFNVTSMHSWADRSRTYFCTIGGHNFYL